MTLPRGPDLLARGAAVELCAFTLVQRLPRGTRLMGDGNKLLHHDAHGVHVSVSTRSARSVDTSWCARCVEATRLLPRWPCDGMRVGAGGVGLADGCVSVCSAPFAPEFVFFTHCSLTDSAVPGGILAPAPPHHCDGPGMPGVVGWHDGRAGGSQTQLTLGGGCDSGAHHVQPSGPI